MQQLTSSTTTQAGFLQFLQSQAISCIIDSEGQKGGLFLGNILAALDEKILEKHRINAVLTVAANAGVVYTNRAHLVISVKDAVWENLRQHFERATTFIQKHIQTTNVLVHCFAGMSRSTTIVLAYLMKYSNLNLTNALALTIQRRPIAQPNDGFLSQLRAYQVSLRISRTNYGGNVDKRTNRSHRYSLQELNFEPESSQNNMPSITKPQQTRYGRVRVYQSMNKPPTRTGIKEQINQVPASNNSKQFNNRRDQPVRSSLQLPIMIKKDGIEYEARAGKKPSMHSDPEKYPMINQPSNNEHTPPSHKTEAVRSRPIESKRYVRRPLPYHY